MSEDEGARRRARARWEARVFRGDDWRAMQAADDEFWARIPLDQRARVVWELSKELFGMTDAENRERRLPRSAFGVVRR